MTEIQLQSVGGQQVTCVPNIFIDQYMLEANGEFIKIYLYLLRLLGQNQAHFSIPSIADALQFTEGDVRRALVYWEKKHLFRLTFDDEDNLTSICVLNPTVSAPDTQISSVQIGVKHPAGSNERPVTSRAQTPQKVDYGAEEISAFQTDEAVQELLMVAERYMGRTLTMTDISTILFWYDKLHFSTELIEYLVEYCVEKGHTSIHYMNKVALDWSEQKITTVDMAKQAAKIHSQSYYAVMKAFGISGRNLVDREISYIEKWTNDYSFTLDIINEACDRTIQNIGRANFEYADKMLTSWHNKGIQHLEDVSVLDKQYAAAKKAPATKPKSRFHNFDSRDEDEAYYEELEQKLLRK